MTKKAVLAGGCFWGMQELLCKEPGVLKTRVGYTGGKSEREAGKITYENHPGHAEAVEVLYDAEKTSYEKILDFFFRIHDPTTPNQQGNDIGPSYRSAIFCADEEEKGKARDFINLVNKSGRFKNPVVTAIESLSEFYEAEEYHQDYLQKNPGGYTCHAVRFDSLLQENILL